jgi:hypothetical protein
MQIAQGIDAGDWKRVDFDSIDGWSRAVDIFERRIRGRFTEAADFLIADDETRPAVERRWGFAVLAIDCLLVETLEAFRQGMTNTKSQSKALCVAFLSTKPAFVAAGFDAKLAERFYYEFRCGLHHNGQVFGTGRVWSIGPLLDVDATGRITVNRTAFHKALCRELDHYVADLRGGKDSRLRDNFKTKMDFIADAKF